MMGQSNRNSDFLRKIIKEHSDGRYLRSLKQKDSYRNRSK